MTEVVKVPRFRLGLLLWAAAMLGVIAYSVTLLPELAEFVGGGAIPVPMWVISMVTVVQTGVVVGLAAWAGVALAPAVGLHAPVFEALAKHRPMAAALSPQLLPALIAGLVGGMFLVGSYRYAPAGLAGVWDRFSFPLVSRVLYGGITEEVLLRWGVMTALVWLPWRFLQHRQGRPAAGSVWLAIAVTTLVFGAGHLPLAAILVGKLTAPVVVWVIGANGALGLLFGYLFWRWGLESAMIAHALTHVVNYFASSP